MGNWAYLLVTQGQLQNKRTVLSMAATSAFQFNIFQRFTVPPATIFEDVTVTRLGLSANTNQNARNVARANEASACSSWHICVRLSSSPIAGTLLKPTFWGTPA
jgi:hypothetical protein